MLIYKPVNILSKNVTSNTIVHANWIFPAGTMARIISKKYKIPFIISLMGSDVNRLLKGTSSWKSARTLLLKANRVTAVTDDLFKKCASLNINIEQAKKTLIDNIYDTRNFIIKDRKHVKNLLGLEDRDKILFFAGGLIPVKNVNVLIEAFSHVVKTNYNLSLFIAGSGSEEGNLKRLVLENNIRENVKFLGPLVSEDLINYYNAADLFCLPSKSEGLPNVIVEALFCGTPVVASSVGGIPTIIKPGENGFLVEPNSVYELADKINEGLCINWDRNKIRDSISQFAPDNVLTKYKLLYNSLMDQNPNE